MDAITPTNGAASSTQSAASANLSQQAGASKVDYDAFLKLLVAQMRNQDPTKPTDSAEYLSQLASFSSVEQQISANRRLESLISFMAFQQGSSLLGKSITADGISGQVEVVSVEKQGNLVQLKLSNGSSISADDVTSVQQGS